MKNSNNFRELESKLKVILQRAISGKYIYFLGITALAIATAVVYLSPFPQEFPIDDTYIHFVYAENFSNSGDFFFNSPADKGIGTTSPLWVFLLSFAKHLNLSLPFTAKVLGFSFLLVSAFLVYKLALKAFGFFLSISMGILLVLSGNMLWFSLSGMETTLFLSLGLLSIYLFSKDKWLLCSLSLGFLMLTRPEGIALLASICLYQAIQTRRVTKEILQLACVSVLIAAPWFLFLFTRTGHLLPTSAIGKRLSVSTGINIVASQNPQISSWLTFPGVVYTLLWIVYIFLFLLGGMSLPGPYLEFQAIAKGPNLSISIWSLLWLSWFIVQLVSLVIKKGSIKKLLSSRIFENADLCPLVVFSIWFLFHNIVFALFLPIPGSASRYGAINHIFIWSTVIVVLFTQHRHRWVFLVNSFIIFSLLISNLILWNRIYDANLDYMNKVRIRSTEFLRNVFSDDETCAAFDIGAIRYFSKREIVDLGGLINPQLGDIFEDNNLDVYLSSRAVECLALPDDFSSPEGKVFDYGETLGLLDSNLFYLQMLKSFSIPYSEWYIGFLPTNNYQPAVTIYRIVQK